MPNLLLDNLSANYTDIRQDILTTNYGAIQPGDEWAFEGQADDLNFAMFTNALAAESFENALELSRKHFTRLKFNPDQIQLAFQFWSAGRALESVLKQAA